MSDLKRTALFDEHQRLGGRMVPFGGWELPVQYTGLLDEHVACRTAAGLFDVSHMGEFLLEGPGATEFLNFAVTNDVSKVAVHQAQYTTLCQPDGGVVDDLVLYRRGEEKYFIVVNASNVDKDFKHFSDLLTLQRQKFPELRLENRSSDYTQIALQGPLAERILQPLTQSPLGDIKTYWFTEGQVAGVSTIIARTGYTGEDGFELYVPWGDGPKVWLEILKQGQPIGLKPCGLGARDTLRLEMKYPLYGHEITDKTHPLEASLGWVVKLGKSDFVGRSALVSAQEKGIPRKLVGLELQGKRIPRQDYPIVDLTTRETIGIVTSGTFSPSLQKPIAIAYVPVALSAIGSKVGVLVRDQVEEAIVVSTPFYKKSK